MEGPEWVGVPVCRRFWGQGPGRASQALSQPPGTKAYSLSACLLHPHRNPQRSPDAWVHSTSSSGSSSGQNCSWSLVLLLPRRLHVNRWQCHPSTCWAHVCWRYPWHFACSFHNQSISKSVASAFKYPKSAHFSPAPLPPLNPALESPAWTSAVPSSEVLGSSSLTPSPNPSVLPEAHSSEGAHKHLSQAPTLLCLQTSWG